jgi:hypothetical protein
VAAYVRSRPHVYLDWDTQVTGALQSHNYTCLAQHDTLNRDPMSRMQVMPMLLAAALEPVTQWIADDRVAGAEATRSLHALALGPSVIRFLARDELPAAAGGPGPEPGRVADALIEAGADANHAWARDGGATGFSLLMQVRV